MLKDVGDDDEEGYVTDDKMFYGLNLLAMICSTCWTMASDILESRRSFVYFIFYFSGGLVVVVEVSFCGQSSSVLLCLWLHSPLRLRPIDRLLYHPTPSARSLPTTHQSRNCVILPSLILFSEASEIALKQYTLISMCRFAHIWYLTSAHIIIPSSHLGMSHRSAEIL